VQLHSKRERDSPFKSRTLTSQLAADHPKSLQRRDFTDCHKFCKFYKLIEDHKISSPLERRFRGEAQMLNLKKISNNIKNSFPSFWVITLRWRVKTKKACHPPKADNRLF